MKFSLILLFLATSMAQGTAYGSNFSCAAYCEYSVSVDCTGSGCAFPSYAAYSASKRIFSVAPQLEDATASLEGKCLALAKDYATKHKGGVVVPSPASTKLVINGESSWNLRDPGDRGRAFNPITDCLP
jgi:hypothetical protein